MKTKTFFSRMAWDTSQLLRKSLTSLKVLTLLLGLVLSVNVWGAEEVYKETAFSASNNEKANDYTSTWTSTNNGFTVSINNFNNFNNGWDDGATIKAGAKKSKGSDPAKVTSSYIATSAAIDKAITKIIVYGSLANNNTVVSTLSVASNNTFTSGNTNITGPTAFSDGKMTFTVSGSGLPTENKFYKIAFTVTNNTTSNGSLVVTKVEYYTTNTPAKTLSSIAVTAEPKKTYTTCETLDLTDCVVTATYSDGSKDDVTSQCTFNPANGAALTTDVTSVLVSYGGKNATIENISVEEGKQDTFIDNIQGNEITYGVCSYSVPTLDSKSAAAPTGDCEDDHYKFIGWTTGSYSSGITATNQLENFIEGGVQNTATGKTYYAVWAKEEL